MFHVIGAYLTVDRIEQIFEAVLIIMYLNQLNGQNT